jgi:hypothetical protein
MVLFVLYIEPLIREMSAEVYGYKYVGKETIKVLGYADDINFMVQNDVERGRVFAAADRFCTKSNARVNLSKSAFMKNFKLGPQVI